MGDAPNCESERSITTNEKTNECLDNRSLKIDGRDVVVKILTSEKDTSSKIGERNENSSEIVLTKTTTTRRASSGVEKRSVSKKTTERVEKTKVSASPRNKSNLPEKQSNLPILKSKKSGSTSSLVEKKGSPSRLAKSESVVALGKEGRGSQIPAKSSKVPPKVPAKPKIPRESAGIGKESVGIGKESVEIGSNGSVGSPPRLKDGKLSKEPSACKEPELRQKIGNEGLPRPKNAAKDAKDYIADFNSKILKFSRPVSDSAIQSAQRQEPAHKNRLQRSQSKVEKLQRDLKTKIEASNYNGELAGSRASGLRFPAVFGAGKLDLNENVTRGKSDKEFAEKEFLDKHNLDKKLTIEEKRVLETDLDYVSDSEKSESLFGGSKSADRESDKRQYRRSVSEIEKRWSGEFLEGQYDHHSSESSKSSYVEELGSASSHEGLVVDANAKFIEEINRRSARLTRKSSRKNSAEDLLEDTVSTVDSNSCVEEKLKDAEGLISSKSAPNDDSNGSKASTLKKSSVSTIKSIDSSGTSKASETLASRSSQKELEASNNLKNSADTDRKPIDVVNNNVASANGAGISSRKELTSPGPKTTKRRSLESSQENTHSDKDGYADLIKTFAMEAGTSRSPKEEKKRKGFRRLLPASLFSPKDSRKDYKKDQKERKKRDEKHFSQYQQNGNYTRSPDTMNLNEDIKRNVKLNTSLNSSIIEERLNEIKQELFPEQVLTTSTPDHFLHTERDVRSNSRDQRFYTTNSSLSSIAPEDKWIDQHIISGSPDMRKLKQKKGETDRKCALERKHSLQEAPTTDGRFIRNHGPSGRTSAPPGERFLIRPRAVHPVDRPLPAIPQRVELYADYDNHHPTQRGPQNQLQEAVEFPEEAYAREIQDYQNANQLYEERNNFDKTEANRNHSIDSGFNLTPVSAQVKITRQPVINQNQKAPLVGRSPKYSPSSSQKSGDYADSSYTPNSSQKSEFSPTSSKSGEYYLNSSRTSDHTSPNDSLNEKREQIYENNGQQPKIPYPISPNVKIQNRPVPVYDLSPSFKDSQTLDRARSPPPYQDLPPDPRTPKQNQDDPSSVYPPRTIQEPVYVQRTSPQIPLSTNLAKMRAHTENEPSPSSLPAQRQTSPIRQLEERANTPPRMYRDPEPSTEADRRKAYEMRVDSPTRYVTASPSGRPLHPTQSSQSPNSPRLKSPTRSPGSTFVTSQRVTSPLTVLPLDHPKSSPASQSPHSQQNTSVSPLPRSMSPQSRAPTTSPRTNDSRQRGPTSGPYMPMSSRRSQPNEQILIASPKRDAYYESQIYSRGSGSRVPGYPVSPVPMTDSPTATVDASDVSVVSNESLYEGRQSLQRGAPIRTLSPRGTQRESPREQQNNARSSGNTVEIQRPEPIYGQRMASPSRNQEAMYTQRALSPTRGQDAYSSGNENRGVRSTSTSPAVRGSTSPQPTIYSNEQRRVSPVQQPLAPGQQQSMYTSRSEPLTKCDSQQSIYGTRLSLNSDSSHVQGPSRQASPTKRQTMQHLEAYYWQQKALEAQKKTPAAPAVRRQTDPRIDHPEIREAMYWHQLKKMEEEQQKKIYQQNVRDERTDPLYWRKKLQSPPTSPTTLLRGQEPTPKARSGEHTGENIYWRSKLQQPKSPVVSKPPIMSQKGQNQPVLVVRPQPVYQAKDYESRELYVTKDAKQDPPPRSKSASPLFVRSDERRSLSLPRKPDSDDGGFLRGGRERSSIAALRKVETPSVYEEDMEGDKKPPPIFKRGSLLSNSSNSVDYGTGQKRVSFSNQTANPEVGAGTGIWPTKHGMAPEPPTRQHRVERSSTTSDTDSVFLHEAENENNANTNLYGNLPAKSGPQTVVGSVPRSPSRQNATEYDANRPLPPPPRDMLRFIRRSSSVKDQTRNNQTTKGEPIADGRRVAPTNNRRWPAVSESESGSEAGEIQRILRRRNEEEWNPDSKGRQSNDSGGSGRGEGEGGTGDLPGAGRRIGVGGPAVRGSGGSGGRSRDEPRRHTLSGDHQPSLHHQQFNSQLHPLHPHHLPPPHGQYGSAQNRHATTMDLEMGTKSRQRKSPLPRGYPPPSTAMLFDDDPGIMSEVETSSTGFRRGGKQRSSLPVVRTASKTLERPLGLVFLQYRNETKRALLPNEITSIDTVKALFVRSFPKQLTMEYLDSPLVKVYIHDSNKDMFYELEDMRSHLRDIRDRSVLRLFESSDGVAGMPGPLGAPGGGGGLPPHWEDQSYFSEPEFDSEYQHQHIHKSKTAKSSTSGSGGYYMGSSSTLPRGGPLLRAYSPAASSVVAGPNASSTQAKSLGTPGGGGGVPPAKPLRSYQCGKSPLGNLGGSARFSRDSSVSLYSIPDRLHGENGYMSSPERSGGVGAGSGRYPGGPYSTGSSYEDPYYSQYSGTVTPVIDEEASDTELLEESYSLYGVKPPGRPPSGPPRSPFPPGAPALTPGGQPYDATRIRVEHMERQLANLTGLVQKALTHAPHATPSARDYLQVPAARDPYRTTGAGDEFDKHSSSSSASLPDDSYLRTDVKPPKLGKGSLKHYLHKSVSFEKSVSFSDEPPDMNSPKQHSPQHAADTKPTKPAIKSSTLPRMSSQERDRHKPTPPPKPATLAAGQYMYRDLALTPEMYNQLRGLQKKAKDLRQEVRNIMRMSQAQALTVRETIRDTSITIRAVLLSGGDAAWANGDTEKVRLSREEDLYKQGMLRLEKDLTELESSIEELRGNVINRKTRVNMSDVENMALILSKSSKTVADLKVRFPSLQEGMKGLLSAEMEKVIREEKFLKEEPERLESALHRCKKLTGTLVTLKRLASVQEQRLPNAASVEAEETPPITPTSAQHSKATAPVPAERTVVGSANVVGGGSHAHESSGAHQQRPENALDALLDELQTFSRPGSQLSQTSSIGYAPSLGEVGRSTVQSSHQIHPGGITEMSRKGSIDSSTSFSSATPGHTSTLRRLHSYPSSSDTDTSPPIARLQVSDGATTPSQKPPVPERNAELLQLATARRVPPPPPPRTSSRSPLASPTSPQLPPRNPTTTGTLRRGRSNPKDSGKPPMALPSGVVTAEDQQPLQPPPNNMLSASNSSSCESINSQEGMQNKKGRQEQLEQRHQELLRKQKALQEQYARLQQLQRNASGLTTVPPTPPDLLKKTGSESNLLAKMGLGLSTASSGSLTSLAARTDLTTTTSPQPNQATTNKIYETDIL